jgi:hypothetical protein
VEPQFLRNDICRTRWEIDYLQDTIFDEDLEVDPRGWAWIDFDAEKGDILEIVAKESDGYSFDIYIVHKGDVTEDKLWLNHALFRKLKETYYRGEYQFENSGSFSLVIGNYRALEVIREVHVKLVLRKVDKKEMKALEKEQKKSSKRALKETKKDETKFPESNIVASEFSWKGVLIIVAIICALVIIAFAMWFVHPFLGGAVLAVGGGLLFSVGRKDVRKLIGLEHKE